MDGIDGAKGDYVSGATVGHWAPPLSHKASRSNKPTSIGWGRGS